MKIKQFIGLFLISILLVSCAQVVPLSGGEKDIDPPKEIESFPKNGNTNFSEKTITIKFDEFIRLTNLSSQLIISPLMETPPEVTIKGKKLVITLDSELKENTTYSINFGNAITDITENNVFPNYKYVFSTGSYIDSLQYNGTIINAFDLTQIKGTYVLLYDQFEDSVPLKELPKYIALTDENGSFSITNIANGKYKLFAINDINNNYLFDLPNEEIGFISQIITIDSSSTGNMISLFKEDGDVQYVVKAENKTYGKVDLILNSPTENLTVTPLGVYFKQQWYFEEKNNTGDSLTLWLTTTEGMQDLELLVQDEDKFEDTAKIKLIPREEFKDTMLQVRTNISPDFDINKNIVITTKRPIKKETISEIKLLEDSTEVSFNYTGDQRNSLRDFTLNYVFKENTNYQLFIPPKTFTDILDLKNDTLKIDFKTKKESDYGHINLDILPSYSDNNILQLFKGKKIIKEVYFKGRQKLEYSYLLPGDYSLKLIIDSNNDNEWSTGDYLKSIQPETVIYYEKEIQIKANWDNNISWTIIP